MRGEETGPREGERGSLVWPPSVNISYFEHSVNFIR